MGKSQSRLSGDEISTLKDLFLQAFRMLNMDMAFENIEREDVKTLQRAMNEYVKVAGLLTSMKIHEKYREETSYATSSRALYDYYRHLKNHSDEIPFSVKVLNSLTNFATKGKVALWAQYRSGNFFRLKSDPQESASVPLSESIISYLEKLAAVKKIGFEDDEEITYQISYGKWVRAEERAYHDYRICEEEQVEDRYYALEVCEEIQKEDDLEPIDVLLKQHFSQSQEKGENYSLTFILADFGKGKSVLLNELSTEYARNLISTDYSTKEYFPVYINLRDASDCLSKADGLINTYLRRYRNFGVEDLWEYEHVVFFLDSFDEISAVLTAREIVEDILPVLEKRKNSKTNFRIVIATRPISSLEVELDSERLNPFSQKLEYYGHSSMFIHAFGFTIIQIEDFFEELGPEVAAASKNLLQKNVLSISELRRPLLCYILYKVIQNGEHLDQLSNISIYLAFINYLTIEAKYIGDPDVNQLRTQKSQPKHSFHRQAVYRSILHGMSLLWLMNRSGVKRALDYQTVELTTNNLEVLLFGEDKDSGVKGELLVEYLSNSYFGENHEHFRFKHQSFAEILLAEYYLKVLLVFAFEKRKVYELDTYLGVGRPTKVTIEFYKELLKLLKISTGAFDDKEVLHARRLLSPLLTSIAIEENNQLYSPNVDQVWRTSINRKHFEFAKEFPIDEVFEQWPINANVLGKICDLCEERIDHEVFTSYDIVAQEKVGLVSRVRFHESMTGTLGQDHLWILLIAGNYLYNDVDARQFFAGRIKPNVAFQLIKMARFGEEDLLNLWGTELFRGIDLRNRVPMYLEELAYVNFSKLDFSYGYFRKFYANMVDFSRCRFDHCTFESYELSGCNLENTSFQQLVIKSAHVDHGFSSVQIYKNNYITTLDRFPPILIQHLLMDVLRPEESVFEVESIPALKIEERDIKRVFENLSGFWRWVFKNRNLSKVDFLAGFVCDSLDEDKQQAFNSTLGEFYDRQNA